LSIAYPTRQIYTKQQWHFLECCGVIVEHQGLNAAYAMISNKWCHSAIFEQAGLGTPATWRSLIDKHYLKMSPAFHSCTNPTQEGLERILKMDRPQANLPKTHDDMAVLQEYITPRAGSALSCLVFVGKGTVRVDSTECGWR
jgi:hypothetical protein